MTESFDIRQKLSQIEVKNKDKFATASHITMTVCCSLLISLLRLVTRELQFADNKILRGHTSSYLDFYSRISRRLSLK